MWGFSFHLLTYLCEIHIYLYDNKMYGNRPPPIGSVYSRVVSGEIGDVIRETHIVSQIMCLCG